MKKVTRLLLGLWMVWLSYTPCLFSQNLTELSAMSQLKHEGIANSHVMENLFYLTDVYGPRLTNSEGFNGSAQWVIQQLKQYGLTNVHVEPWGPFGQSWTLKHFSMHLVSPSYQPLIGMPFAWTPGTGGPVDAEAMLIDVGRESDLTRYRGKLRGKIVLATRPQEIPLTTEFLAPRFTDTELAEMEKVRDLSKVVDVPKGIRVPPRMVIPDDLKAASQLKAATYRFLKEEGALAIVECDYTGDGGTVFVTSGGSRRAGDPSALPTVGVTPEHYNRMARLLQHGIPVKLQLDVQVEFSQSEHPSFNIIADLPGTEEKDEIVMIGAHLDSWHGATGATDDGGGVAAAMEAMRLLVSLHRPLKRTVRLALWGGEEEGLLGSKAYAAAHLAPGSEGYKNFRGYFNFDSGSGRIRGINVDGNDVGGDILKAWLKPVRDMGAFAILDRTKLNMRSTGGTDSMTFARVGLPAFSFVHDPLDYLTRTHHSNMDFYDRVQKGDLIQSSIVMAWLSYCAATAPSPLQLGVE